MAGFIETHLPLAKEDYYKFRSEKLKPRDGHYLFERMPCSDLIRITRPDGSTKTVNAADRSITRNLVDLGIDAARHDRVITHIYNFISAYVKVEHADSWGKQEPVQTVS